jgi:hypothetical protein
VDVPHPLDQPADGLDRGELERLAGALRGLGEGDLEPVLASVPVSWPVSDAELEEVRRYLLARAPQVAERLDELRSMN